MPPPASGSVTAVTDLVANRPVAVIVPVRDCERYVAEAIDSILSQTVSVAEVVVVDDGSRDGTPEVLAGYGAEIRVERRPPRGQFAAMNHGIAVSESPILGFLDADDVFTPDSIAVRLQRLLADDAPDAVFGMTEQFLSPDLGPDDAARLRCEPGPFLVELFQTMLIRRDAFLRVGPLDTDLTTSANIDWISRMRVAGTRSAHIDHVVGRRRLHTANLGLTESARNRDDLLTVIRTHRQRTAGAD
jgi:glycosyltransferase involved in cell wall biosynthesis